jgi:tRNA threonylcarbamoyladenosine biosynthesis protein TsaB
MDARMKEVYTAEFSLSDGGLVVAESAEAVCRPEDLAGGEAGFTVAAGNGFERYEALAGLDSSLQVCDPDCWPQARFICRLADAWLAENEGLPAAQAQPMYIRDKVAEKPG